MKNTLIISNIILLILCIFFYKRWTVQELSPPVIGGQTFILDTIIIRDTIIDTLPKFIIKKVPISDGLNISKDSFRELPPIILEASDSAVRYEMSREYPNGAKVEAVMSSRYFPDPPPIDLKKYLSFFPGNDSIKIIHRIDSVPKFIYKKPIIPTWQAVTLGVLGGVIVAWVSLKK
jgi:hypothetical protein